MIESRRATADDADELMRLRVVMLTAVNGAAPAPGDWLARGVAQLRERLAEPTASFAAFVVDDPQLPGRLAASAVGTVDVRLPTPRNPTGLAGYVFGVSTDPQRRRRGYSRACMRAVLDWLDDTGVSSVSLLASDDGAPLYVALGFAATREISMKRYRSGGPPTAG